MKSLKCHRSTFQLLCCSLLLGLFGWQGRETLRFRGGCCRGCGGCCSGGSSGGGGGWGGSRRCNLSGGGSCGLSSRSGRGSLKLQREGKKSHATKLVGGGRLVTIISVIVLTQRSLCLLHGTSSRLIHKINGDNALLEKAHGPTRNCSKSPAHFWEEQVSKTQHRGCNHTSTHVRWSGALIQPGTQLNFVNDDWRNTSWPPGKPVHISELSRQRPSQVTFGRVRVLAGRWARRQACSTLF